MAEYYIPRKYAEGEYLLKEFENFEIRSDDDTVKIEYDEDHDIITFLPHDLIIYSAGVDLKENIKIIYRSPYAYFRHGEGNNLESIYVIDKKGNRLHSFWDIGESMFEERAEDLFEKMQYIIVNSAKGITEDLSSADAPMQSLIFEYYLEGNDARFNVMGTEDDNIYEDCDPEVSQELECLIKCLPYEKIETVFMSILFGVYNRLTYDIPAKYELSENFEIYFERFD